MPWTLPPLNAIRSFEAAARHQSFALAAQELHVTPGAISRQIKVLENILGTRLFARANRQVQLSAEGRTYFISMTDALRRIDAATSHLLAGRRGRPLRIMCSVVVAMRWLFPRLPEFHAKHPHMHLSLTTTMTPVATEFDAQNADVAIRTWDGKGSPELASDRLFSSQLVAICSPKLVESRPGLRTLADLRSHTLLSSALRPQAWARWLEAAGAPSIDSMRVDKLETSALAYQAAIEGLGVALGERSLIAEDLRRKQLVLPFGFVYSGPEAFYLIYQKQSEQHPFLREFRLWMIEEARLVAAALAQPPVIAKVSGRSRARR